MSPHAKKFCQWMLTNRKNEMIYRSLHIRFQKNCLEILAKPPHRYISDKNREVYHLGTLAAMSAIWIWCVPLRVSNMCDLTLFCDAPQVLLPAGKNPNLRIRIFQENTKNGKPIEHRMSPGRHRGIEIVKWYVDKIRPTIPGAKQSQYSFPASSGSGNALSTNNARDWLRKYGAKKGTLARVIQSMILIDIFLIWIDDV